MKKLLFLSFLSFILFCGIIFLFLYYHPKSESDILVEEMVYTYIPNPSGFSFGKAKKVLLEKVYHDHLETFYCACGFDFNKKITENNGFQPKTKRGKKIEWEHIVPAYVFGSFFPEWENGHEECITSKGKHYKGRRCVKKVHEEFRQMEADMYNLVPAVNEINGLRSNYSFTIIPGEEREFGTCDMEIQNKQAEPREEIRGNIARIYIYMDKTYPKYHILNSQNKQMMEEWQNSDPVDKWECDRIVRVNLFQKNENHFTKELCIEAGFWPSI